MEHQSDGGLSLPRPFSFWQTCQVRRFLVLGTLPRGTAIRFTCYATANRRPEEISADHRGPISPFFATLARPLSCLIASAARRRRFFPTPAWHPRSFRRLALTDHQTRARDYHPRCGKPGSKFDSPDESRKTGWNPSCSKWQSLVSTSVNPLPAHDFHGKTIR